MKLTFAIADLHGRFDLLQAAYGKITEYASAGRIVHLGDYVDRGPQSREIIEFLIDEATIPEGFTRVVLKGNHEDMMVETLTAPLNPQWWIGNGGGQTLVSYGHAAQGKYTPEVVPREHISWLRDLPKILIDEHRVYVHAGVDPTRDLDDQKEEVLLWWLYPDNADLGHGNRHVVHGHHQFEDGPKLFANRTDLDTFAWFTGRLVVGVFDDDQPRGPVAQLVVRRPA